MLLSQMSAAWTTQCDALMRKVWALMIQACVRCTQVSTQLWESQVPAVLLFENGKEVARRPDPKRTAQRRRKLVKVRLPLSFIIAHVSLCLLTC